MDLSVIYCDGSHNGESGDEAWGSVVDKNGKDLLQEFLFLDINTRKVQLPLGVREIIPVKFNDVKSQQNNGGELMAFYAALRIADTEDDVKIIRSDSQLLVKWWTVTGVNKKTVKSIDPRKLGYINDCIELRKEFESRGGKVEWIPGNINKADLGFHK